MPSTHVFPAMDKWGDNITAGSRHACIHQWILHLLYQHTRPHGMLSCPVSVAAICPGRLALMPPFFVFPAADKWQHTIPTAIRRACIHQRIQGFIDWHAHPHSMPSCPVSVATIHPGWQPLMPPTHVFPLTDKWHDKIMTAGRCACIC